MSDIYDERVSVAALTVACPVCGVEPLQRCLRAAPGSLIPYQVKERPHYARYELAVKPAVEEAVQKFAEPEPEGKELLLTLHVLDDTQRRSYRLDIVTDEESRFAYLTVKQFAALLAGDQIKIQADL